ncbi:N-acetyltransferase B complex non catalytic subunit-domain-containing protein [Astrocystis sublimbata]|nr:N-acetyltransferase B complex non catalytic subunit-domain-containing protein [Astrocystis sublimbata]
MTTPRIAPLVLSVQLKHTVSLDLQQAWAEEQWALAAKLAQQHLKATKDEYYKAVELAAGSRGDTSADCVAAYAAVRQMKDDGTIIKDPDVLDLYEFAVASYPTEYARTIGVLRGRLVKALPKEFGPCSRCFFACMRHSDWENAQEISASLNKNFPSSRHVMFFNILATYLVATAESAPMIKKQLFPKLVKAQIDKALQTSATRLPSEDEVQLWILIREKFGTAEENFKSLQKPDWSPLFFLQSGCFEAFLRSMQLMHSNKQWEFIINTTFFIFSKVLSPSSEEENQEQYTTAATSWTLWETFCAAAVALHDPDHKALNKFIKHVTQVTRMSEGKNLVLGMNAEFIILHANIYAGRQASRKAFILKFIELAKRRDFAATDFFSRTRTYLQALDDAETAELLDMLKVHSADANLFERLLLVALRLKIWFHKATSLTPGDQCCICQSIPPSGTDCMACLKSITECALDAFAAGIRDRDASQKAARESQDPLANLAMLGSICLIKLAGGSMGAAAKGWFRSPLYQQQWHHFDVQLFLQAVFWLDFYTRKAAHNNQLRLMLIRLYLKLGCVTRALDLVLQWDIKNPLLESMAMLYLDRLASISPGHFVTRDSRSRTRAEPLCDYFSSSIAKTQPKSVVQSLQKGSYATIPRLVELAELQSRNCASVWAVLEGRRGLRLESGRTETDIKDEPLIGPLNALNECYELSDRTDYNTLPQWAGDRSPSVQELTAYGPLPTHRRTHMGVLVERFIDIVCYVQPKDFKPSRIPTHILQEDWRAAAEHIDPIRISLESLLFAKPDSRRTETEPIPVVLTIPEEEYFRTILSLADVVVTVLRDVLSSPSPYYHSSTYSKSDAKNASLQKIAQTLKSLTEQSESFFAIPKGIPAKMHTLHGVASTHAMGMLRDAALVTKYTVQYLKSALDRLKTTDKVRGMEAAAWLLPELNKLATEAMRADSGMNKRLVALNENLNKQGWNERVADWVFGDNVVYKGDEFSGLVAEKLGEVVPRDAREVFAEDVTASWRDVVRGWIGVKWES